MTTTQPVAALMEGDGWKEIPEEEIRNIVSKYGTQLLMSAQVNPGKRTLTGTFGLVEKRRQEESIVSTYEYDKCLNQGTFALLVSLLKYGDSEVHQYMGDNYLSVAQNGARFHRKWMEIEYGSGHPSAKDFEITFMLEKMKKGINGVVVAHVEFSGPVEGKMGYGLKLH